MKEIPTESIDLILCDLPYGTTRAKWDKIIPLDNLWEQYKRIIKKEGAIVLTSCQPFTSMLVMSNLKMFKYELIWNKKKPSNFLNANRTPLMKHENILVFYNKHGRYNPQKELGRTRFKGGKKYGNNGAYGNYKEIKEVQYNKYFPKSILEISNANQKGKIHSAQKPVALMEYLIKTYSNEGDKVLDNCMGSGTTGVACKKLNRDFIGFELDEQYFKIAEKRIRDAQAQKPLAFLAQLESWGFQRC